MGRAYSIALVVAWIIAGAVPLIPQGRGGEKKVRLPGKGDSTEQLLKDLENDAAIIRAVAIDVLAVRKAWEAVPKLIDLIADGTSLDGSDNWVGASAAKALSHMTGRPFSVDQKDWKRWWVEEQKRSANAVGTGAEEKKVSPPTERVAYGDTPEFWDSHALVVATVDIVRHGEDGPDRVKSEVILTVQESVPSRYTTGTRFSITFLRNWRLGPVRDKPVGAIDLKSRDRVLLIMTEEEKGRLVPALPQVMDYRLLKVLNATKEKGLPDLSQPPKPIEAKFLRYTSYAMLPDVWKLHFPKEDDAVVAETVRVCRALSEKDVARRLELIAALQKTKPNARVQDLLRRRLEVTLESTLREAQEAMRLLKEAGKK